MSKAQYLLVNIRVAKSVGMERATLLEYIKANKQKDGWTRLGMNEQASDPGLSVMTITTIYHYLKSLADKGYIERQYGCKNFSSSYKLTALAEALFEE